MISVFPLELDLFALGAVTGATAGDPQHAGAIIVEQNGIRVGTWRCEPGEFPWTSANGEMFHVIEGAGSITDEEGAVHEIAPGKVFYMTPGATVHWKVTETVRKSYVVPAPQEG
jgi:uncharacterized cupin superfamily protein